MHGKPQPNTKIMNSQIRKRQNTVVPFSPKGALNKGDVIRRILHISEVMLREAEASSWAAVTLQDEERQRLAWTLSKSPLNEIERKQWNTQLTRILAISRQLTDVARKERAEVATQLLEIRKGGNMERAYGVSR